MLAALLAAAGAAAAPLRIMPLGDSITEGAAGSASYRYWLAKDLAKAGVDFDFVGSAHGVRGGAPRFGDFDADHEGHWGWTTGQVLSRIGDWAAAGRPDVVLVHLGTNDVVGAPAAIPANLASIIDRLRAVNPHVVVLVARLIPISGVAGATLRAVNESIERMARGKSAPGSPVVVVPQDEGFDAATDTDDGIHPDESGERKMAARWFAALAPFLRDGR
ncbi:MAG: cellulose-binding protein [Deltaproteobacteria bacterium]|nr:cellulose-binding protein [Deltaproteobacteria bacterium]